MVSGTLTSWRMRGPRKSDGRETVDPGLFAENGQSASQNGAKLLSDQGQGEDLVHHHLVLPGLPQLFQLLFQLFSPAKQWMR